MAKGDHGKGGHKAAPADATAKAAASSVDDKSAKAEKRRARKIVKVEVQLADAREIQAAVGALVASLERKLAELQAPVAPASSATATAVTPAPATRRVVRPRAPRATTAKPRATRARAPRKTTPPA